MRLSLAMLLSTPGVDTSRAAVPGVGARGLRSALLKTAVAEDAAGAVYAGGMPNLLYVAAS